ncbi:type ISP restriction/modification enzyme (plasmid) [Pseudalkalibacillus hwajinpoensis]|uniref:type ISP restriction/modification enzyme n=1 Tax=Guptibacillus hwajinpoensis TaxID=208199 RepID=UPI00325C172F
MHNITNNFRSKLLKDELDGDAAFYYVYAMLHSNEYKRKYSSDLSKDFPRIP